MSAVVHAPTVGDLRQVKISKLLKYCRITIL